MVDSANVEQPVYHSHKAYYEWSTKWLRDFQQQYDKLPPDSLLRLNAVS